ncbi:MAG: hypothetical protein HKN04_02315 [Rhodothermaceae bacterium]|nr:hypothetical protein [Rhodothermaceae bacterium]
MSDVPTASPSEPLPASGPPAGPPTRPWTILGRLSKAVREQNWFAVALELGIVVLGVVIGFQVTAWGQARSDAAREQTYLRQLAADLLATQQVVARVDSVQALPDRATKQLLRAFYASEAPPVDSASKWLLQSYEFDVARPVLGTAQALVSTGDLNLLRNDSLRSAITAYIDRNEWAVRHQESFQDLGFTSTQALHRTFDFASTLIAIPPAVLDSSSRAKPTLFYPIDLDRPPQPLDVDRFFRDDAARAFLLEINVYQYNQMNLRRQMRDLAIALDRQIQAELDR